MSACPRTQLFASNLHALYLSAMAFVPHFAHIQQSASAITSSNRLTIRPHRNKRTMRANFKACMHHADAIRYNSKHDDDAMMQEAVTYCHNCGTKMERKIPPGDERVRSVCPNCHTIAYENPKLVVGCVPISQDGKRVLLARRALPPVGKWTIPAGFLELGETTEVGAAREAWEETGALLDMNPITLLAVYNIEPANQVQMLYRSRLLNEETIQAGVESQVVQMFEWHDIPWDDLAFPTIKWALEYSIEHLHSVAPPPQLRAR